MIEILKPYPCMKPSGVPWLGQVPEGWELRRIKHLLRERSEKGYPNEPMLAATQTKGVVRKEDFESRTVVATGDLGLLKLVEVDDFVISLRSFQGGIEYARHRGIISPAYNVLSAKDPANHGYLAALFKSKPFIDGLALFVAGIRQGQNIDYERLSRSVVAVPPSDDQKSIVRFIRDTDRKIGRYFHTKQQLVRLLNEEKHAIVHRAVTRGLDPTNMKPSGVDWLGMIPSDWDVLRVKNVASLLRGKFSHRPRNDPAFYDGPFPFIQTGDVARADKTILEYRQTLNERGRAVSATFPAGTLVMAIAANVGDVAVLDFEACAPDSVIGIRPKKGIHRDYLYYALTAMREEFIKEAPVSTQGNLNIARVGEQYLAVPNYNTQTAVVDHIEKETAKVDQVIRSTTREIALVREYRTRLIADVVTGKLDVRDIAAQIPSAALIGDSEPDLALMAEELETDDPELMIEEVA